MMSIGGEIMPNMKNAKKRVKVIAKQSVTNNDYKTSMKIAIMKVEIYVEEKNKEEAKANLGVAIKRIDKATKTNVISKNTCARQKSRLTKKVNNME